MPAKGQNQPNETGKINMKLLQIIFCREDRAYMMV
jgi:hypothetical protein